MPTITIATESVQVCCTVTAKATAKAKMYLTILLVAAACVLTYTALAPLTHDTVNTATIYR
jgi:hypothetical protein